MRHYNDRGWRVGESHGRSTIPDAVVKLIRDLREEQCLTLQDIAERLHLRWQTVQKICAYTRRASVPAKIVRVRDEEAQEEPEEQP